MARGQGEPYTDEENALIRASPFGEKTAELQQRLIEAGFPPRPETGLRQQKRKLAKDRKLGSAVALTQRLEALEEERADLLEALAQNERAQTETKAAIAERIGYTT